MEKLIKDYENICNSIVEKFLKKQGFDVEDYVWIGEVGTGVVCIVLEYYFDLGNIILDLTTKQKKGTILKWYNDSVEYIINTKQRGVNYKSYIKGARNEQFDNS